LRSSVAGIVERVVSVRTALLTQAERWRTSFDDASAEIE
jgi:hypothetical protein